ncbi:hypothetical protein D3C84_846420 [compost metagenome]
MEQGLAVVGEATGAVRHQPPALGRANFLAEVGLAGCAELTVAAFRGVQRDHVIPHRHRLHAFADGLDDAAAFMPEDDWKEAFRIRAGQGKRIGMADAGGDDSHQHLPGLRGGHIDFDDLQRLVRREGDSGS